MWVLWPCTLLVTPPPYAGDASQEGQSPPDPPPLQQVSAEAFSPLQAVANGRI